MPSGRPMIVIIANQASADTMAVSHQPTSTNHRARTRRPGPRWISAGVGGT